MAKYSDKFKLMVVKEYLEGSLGFGLLAKKYGIPNKSQIERWVYSYKSFGEVGIRKRKSKQHYSVQFKLDVLNFRKRTGASYQATAAFFNLSNLNLIFSWNSRFLKEGIDGLREKVKGRPSMSKKSNRKPTKKESKPLLSREEQLERENELLRLEVAYLKKLKALQENPNAFLAKHKQQWHLNSNNKDSN